MMIHFPSNRRVGQPNRSHMWQQPETLFISG
jgi:hypothetical protein